jgi:hypothetical protein
LGYSDYLIYPDGRVFNKRWNRDLKQCPDKKGYLRVSLSNWSHTKYRVHRLIALHYIPNPENKPWVDHINGITNDNRLENLRWVTKQENTNNHKLNSNNTSGITGIWINNKGKKVKYVAAWQEGGKRKTRSFAKIDEAIARRLQKLTELG